MATDSPSRDASGYRITVPTLSVPDHNKKFPSRCEYRHRRGRRPVRRDRRVGNRGQFSCLDPLWDHESGWSVTAANPGSGAYGIPQALPGSRMASAGPDWQTNAATQIKWGLEYIKGSYGSPCAAWAHEQATGWY
jgi:hypothetical protein